MYALDFEYDGKRLSDFGFIICEFDKSGSGFEMISAGSNLSFNTVQIDNGKYFSLQSVKYDECISATFGICKNPDLFDEQEVTNDEYRDLIRWLNRRSFNKLSFMIQDEIRDACYYNASFNVEKVKVADKLVGLNLSMITDKPFGYGEQITNVIKVMDIDDEYLISDISDEIGYVYPDVTIIVRGNGNLRISNSFMDTDVVINKCFTNEVITMHGKEQLIETNRTSHKINNDFNFEFLKIGNDYNNRFNILKFNLPCEVSITYNPIIKDVPN